MRAATTGSTFLRDVARAADAAMATGSETHTYRLAGRGVCVRVAGPGLAADYLHGLAPVAGEIDGPPALTVLLWERTTTGVAPPPPAWGPDDFLPRGRVRGFAHSGLRVTYAGWARTLTVYDAPRRCAYVHVADRSTVPPWVLRAPLRNVLTWWATDEGLAMMHAAAVTDGSRAVLLAGPSGSGKSTTALAASADGLVLLGDDACIVDLDGGPVVHPVYGVAKLEPDALDRIPELATRVVDPDSPQLLVRLDAVAAGGVPLRAVLLPRVADRADTVVTPVSRHEAWRALVGASVAEGEGAGGTTLAPLARLVAGIGCRRLELGRDRSSVVAALRRVLEGG